MSEGAFIYRLSGSLKVNDILGAKKQDTKNIDITEIKIDKNEIITDPKLLQHRYKNV